MYDKEKIAQHVEWFHTKIAANTYQTYDDEDELLQIILQAELKNRGINIDIQTIAMIDRLKRSISQHTGTLWQRILGSTDDWCDLGIGDTSGCDIMNHKRKVVIELKNKWNTMNSSSLESVKNKLKQQVDKGYDAYIGIINPRKGKSYTKIHKGGIKEVAGTDLFRVIYSDDDGNTVSDIRKELIEYIKTVYEQKTVEKQLENLTV